MKLHSMTQRSSRQVAAGFLVLILGGGCESGTAPAPNEPAQVSRSAIISDSAALDIPVAYVSFSPGSFPSGSRVTIKNRHTAASLTTGTVEGGMDPVPVPAVPGDLLTFTIDTGGVQAIGFTQIVPAAAAPSVVRTEPSGGIADAPIEARVRVVFSEPVTPETVLDALRVMQDGNLVAGTVEVSPDGLSATVFPVDYLLPETEYVISVGSDIQDADGSAMEATVEAGFTTAALPFTGTIAFADLTGIWLMNADGTNLRQLTTAPDYNYDGAPAWSPGGDRIAFQRYTGIGNGSGIYLVNADGTNPVGLSPPGVSDQEPTWSPDGQRIAFVSDDTLPPFNRRLYIMNADGTHRVLVIALRQPTEFPAWSPADRIAFTSYGSTTGADIFVVNPDGTNLTTLWDDLDSDWNPAWSPDGSRIAFERNGYLFRVDQDGTHLEQLTTGQGSQGKRPAWSPDGSYVAFDQCCPFRLWIVSLTDGRAIAIADGRAPSWGP